MMVKLKEFIVAFFILGSLELYKFVDWWFAEVSVFFLLVLGIGIYTEWLK